jgi:SAM-dependent methyltransferase
VSGGVWSLWVACRLCGSRDLRVLFTATRSARQVVRCRGCGLVFYNPQPSPAQAAALYTHDYLEDEYPQARAPGQMRLAHRRLARIERETGVGSLLDVGCGRGDFLAVARERGWKAAGLDISPVAARRAATTAGVSVYEGELTDPPRSELGPVDVVTLWDVLEHLTDPLAALAAVPRWLRPGGLLVVQTQNARSVTAAWMGRRWEQFVEFHLYHFSSRTLRRALGRAGFHAVRIEDVEAFADPGPPEPAPAGDHGVRGTLRRLRDGLFVLAGYDRFNVMVATGRTVAEPPP